MNADRYVYKVFLEHLAFGLIIPISIAWQLSKGLTLGEVGIIQAVVLFSTFLLEMPTGIIADKYGRKVSVVMGSIAHTLALFLLVSGNNFWIFLLSSAVTGLGWSLISGAGEALVFDSLKMAKIESKFKHYLSKISIADEISTIIGMILCSLILRFSDMQSALLVGAVIMFLALLYGVVALEEIVTFNRLSQKSEHIEKQPIPNFKKIHLFLGHHKQFIFIMIVFALLYESGRVLWQPQLLSVGFSVESLGIVYALFKTLSLVGSWISNKIPTSHTSFVYIGLCSAAMFILMGLSSVPFVLLGFAGYFLLENMTRILQSDYLNKIAESNNRATFLSANSLVQNSVSSSYTIGLGYIGQSSLFLGFFLLSISKIVGCLILSKVLNQKIIKLR